MTLEELRKAAKDAPGDYLQLVIKRDRAPTNWLKVRVLPGLYGRCVGEVRKGHFLIDTLVEDIQRVLKESEE